MHARRASLDEDGVAMGSDRASHGESRAEQLDAVHLSKVGIRNVICRAAMTSSIEIVSDACLACFLFDHLAAVAATSHGVLAGAGV